MKLTHDERVKIKTWLDKDPNGPDQGKALVLEDGRVFNRVTQYFGGEWKVRIGYEVGTNYPVAMSAPIPADKDSNKVQDKPKVVMVPKLPAPASVAKKKPAGKGNQGAFAAAMALELDNLKKQTKAYLTQPNPMSVWAWDDINPLKEVGKPTTWKVHQSPSKLPTGVTKKAVKGSKALHGTFHTLFVMPGQTFTGQYYSSQLKHLSVPVGYEWVQAANHDLWTLVKK